MIQARNLPHGRVLIIIRQFFPLAAGAETQALRQAKSYIELGHSAHVVTGRHDQALLVEDTIDGVPVTRLGAPRARFLGSLVFLVRLAAYLIMRRKDYDAVLVFQLKQAAAVASLLCAFLRKRVVLSAQSAGELGDVALIEHTPSGPLILWACSRAAAFVSGASEITEDLTRIRIPEDSIHFIPNGIPAEAFRSTQDKEAARSALDIPRDAFVVVNVGRHTAQKDPLTLLSAWQCFAPSHPDAIFLFVGDGDEHAQLVDFVKAHGLAGSVRFDGWRSNVGQYLAAADVFASSSIFEGTHIALGEAMAAGLPVVATPVGGSRDFIRDGASGLHFPVGDADSLAALLSRLAADEGLRARLGKAAAFAADELLSQERTARLHLNLLFGDIRPPRACRKTKIVHLVATLDRGGTERQLAEIAIRIDRNLYESEVICLTRGGPTADTLDSAGITHRVIGKRGRFDLFPLVWLVRHFMISQPDILHTWLFTSNTFGRVAALLSGTKVVIASERSTDPWKTRGHRAIDRVLSYRTRFITANSRAVADSLTSCGISSEKLRVIPNGVDTEHFRPMAPGDARFVLGIPAEGPCFGFIGRLAYEKRPEVFLDVAKRVLSENDAACGLVFGDGPMREDLKDDAKRFKGRLTFFGDTQFPEIAHACLDCLVLTSIWEGFPNVVLEAMASARPVVAVRMPATEELIVDGITGLLVDDDAEAIAAAVARLLAAPEEATLMGLRGRERVLALYSMDKMVEAYQNLYGDARKTQCGGRTHD